MVWLVISTMSSFPSYHHLIKWLRVEREFWVYFMCGWPEGEFREFSPNWNKMGSPQQDHFWWGGIADAIEGGWHLLSWLNFTAQVEYTCWFTFCLFEQVGKEMKERERRDRQKIPESNILNCHHPAYVLPAFSSIIEILWKMDKETLRTGGLSVSTVGRKLRKF